MNPWASGIPVFVITEAKLGGKLRSSSYSELKEAATASETMAAGIRKKTRCNRRFMEKLRVQMKSRECPGRHSPLEFTNLLGQTEELRTIPNGDRHGTNAARWVVAPYPSQGGCILQLIATPYP